MRSRFVILALLGLLAVAGAAEARDTYVQGYTKRDGTYVQPHYRSAPDGNPYNNWSTQGNGNPYTGQEGTKVPDPYKVERPYQTYQPRLTPSPEGDDQ